MWSDCSSVVTEISSIIMGIPQLVDPTHCLMRQTLQFEWQELGATEAGVAVVS